MFKLEWRRRWIAPSRISVPNLLDDAAVIIDVYNADAMLDAKKLVSIRMVLRAMNIDPDIPVGATQGSMSALGYSQSWTMGSNTSVGELYLGKLEKKLLGVGETIGSGGPLQDMIGGVSI